eukprot:364743-Chlamydomonas_euryale.AAC.23
MKAGWWVVVPEAAQSRGTPNSKGGCACGQKLDGRQGAGWGGGCMRRPLPFVHKVSVCEQQEPSFKAADHPMQHPLTPHSSKRQRGRVVLLGEQDGPQQAALGRVEPGAHHHGKRRSTHAGTSSRQHSGA